MAQNVFDATFDANNRIDVNSFDWSHVNNLTTNFGRITPVFCELVPAKGSLRINPEFGLELMPMVFPVQTSMFARLNFFKVTFRSMRESIVTGDRKSTRLNSSHSAKSRMPSSA